MIEITAIHPRFHIEALGLLPHMLDPSDPAPAREQFDREYGWAGGWRPIRAFDFDPARQELLYPGDPPMQAIASARLRDETILFFRNAIVCVAQRDGSFEVARLD